MANRRRGSGGGHSAADHHAGLGDQRVDQRPAATASGTGGTAGRHVVGVEGTGADLGPYFPIAYDVAMTHDHQ